jgi:quercetin dioxygenase-like cupin family protein
MHEAHPAPSAQLFYVISGEGWVRTAGETQPVRAGQAIRWEAGTNHESGSDTGLKALVIEADRVDGSVLVPHR